QTGGKPFARSQARTGPEPRSMGKEQVRYTTPSKLRKITAPKASYSSPAGIASNTGEFSAGDSVSHERFGNGTIVSIEGEPPNTTATVDFNIHGKKKLLLRFAKLTKN
ncbi:MAG: hypothetical protein JXR67_11130, partial [Bacteroidales bacterium]|nr:hypothetical protein [Bacteroidales bacterium]